MTTEKTSNQIRFPLINHLDDKLGNKGIAPGEVMVVAAPTSCGKSQLALNIAKYDGRKNTHREEVK